MRFFLLNQCNTRVAKWALTWIFFRICCQNNFVCTSITCTRSDGDIIVGFCAILAILTGGKKAIKIGFLCLVFHGNTHTFPIVHGINSIEIFFHKIEIPWKLFCGHNECFSRINHSQNVRIKCSHAMEAPK